MKTVVMTGGTAGFGALAAKIVSATPDTQLLLGARGQAAAGIETLPLDLSSLASVRRFAQALGARLGDTAIDALVLNAGVQLPSADSRTEDGFETAFATNHLAHYLLLRLLLPKLARGATVVITTSDTHDPKKISVGPNKFEVEQWAHGTGKGFWVGMRAYAASKLCNLMTARALLTSEPGKTLGLSVIAFTPGFTPDTSLFRSNPRPMRFLLTSLSKLLAPIAGYTLAAEAGTVLADMTLGRITPPPDRIYAVLARRRISWPDPSDIARDDVLVRELWNASARMVGLPEQM